MKLADIEYRERFATAVIDPAADIQRLMKIVLRLLIFTGQTMNRAQADESAGFSITAPGGPPRSDLLLSGEFSGSMGTVMREMVPGVGTQIFYLLRQLRADDVLSNDEIASRLESGRREAETRGAAESEEPPVHQMKIQIAVLAAIAVIVIAALAYALTAGAP